MLHVGLDLVLMIWYVQNIALFVSRFWLLLELEVDDQLEDRWFIILIVIFSQ